VTVRLHTFMNSECVILLDEFLFDNMEVFSHFSSSYALKSTLHKSRLFPQTKKGRISTAGNV